MGNKLPLSDTLALGLQVGAAVPQLYVAVERGSELTSSWLHSKNFTLWTTSVAQ